MTTSPDLLPCVEIGAPVGTARGVVLWLHGLGADGHDFAPIVPALKVDDLSLRYVFPHAPSISVTVNGGMRMPAWYDVTEVDLRREPDGPGVLRSARQIERLLEREKAGGMPAERIVLAGFSQGGAMALHVGLRHAETLAGIMALSTYLPAPEALADERSDAARSVPVLLCHGSADPLVPCARGEEARDLMQSLGQDVSWHTWPMQHEVCAEEIETISAWLRERFTI